MPRKNRRRAPPSDSPTLREKRRRHEAYTYPKLEREDKKRIARESPPQAPARPSDSLEHYQIIFSGSPSGKEKTNPRPADEELDRWSKRHLIPALTEKPGQLPREKDLVPVFRAQSPQSPPISAKERMG